MIWGTVPSVEVRNKRVFFRGVNGRALEHAAIKHWKTSRLGAYFQNSDRFGFSMREFFLPDFLYILRELKAAKSFNLTRLQQMERLILTKTWMQSTQTPPQFPYDLDRLRDLRWTPTPFQMEFLQTYPKFKQQWGLNGALLDSFPGTGKDQPLDCKIRTPSGWISMRDVRVGMQLLHPTHGTSTVVGVFPQGTRGVYKVQFSDGRSTRCGRDHLWHVYDKTTDRVKVLTTGEIMEDPHISRFSIPLVQIPYGYCEEERRRASEELQAWVCVLNERVLSQGEEKILRETLRSIEEGSVGTRLGALSALLMHYGDENDRELVHIPDKLLAVFCQHVVFSLGGYCKRERTHPTNDPQQRIGWELVIRNTPLLQTDASCSHYLSFAKIDYHGHEETQCIAVDRDDGLYVTDHYIVTHNTAMGFFWGHLIQPQAQIIVSPPNALTLVWEKTLKTIFKKPPTYWVSSDSRDPKSGLAFYLVHYQALGRFLDFWKSLPPTVSTIWVDESHNLNETVSKQSQRLVELVRVSKTQDVVFASGTPIKAMGAEMLPMLDCMDPLFTDSARETFLEIFGKQSNTARDILRHRLGIIKHTIPASVLDRPQPTVKEWGVSTPTSNQYTVDSVRKKLETFIVEKQRYYKENAARYQKDFEAGCKTALAKLPASQKRNYDQYLRYVSKLNKNYDPWSDKDLVAFCKAFERDFILPALDRTQKETFKDAVVVVKYVRLKIVGMALGQVLTRERAACIASMVPYIGLPDIIDDGIKKTVLFASSIEAASEAERYLKEKGYRPVMVHSRSDLHLEAAVALFDSDENRNPLIATYKSLSTAVPLVMANQAVLLDSPFREYTATQATARVDRMGQDTEVFIFKPLLDTGDVPNLSVRSRDILEQSREFVADILGLPTSEVPDIDENEEEV